MLPICQTDSNLGCLVISSLQGQVDFLVKEFANKRCTYFFFFFLFFSPTT